MKLTKATVLTLSDDKQTTSGALARQLLGAWSAIGKLRNKVRVLVRLVTSSREAHFQTQQAADALRKSLEEAAYNRDLHAESVENLRKQVSRLERLRIIDRHVIDSSMAETIASENETEHWRDRAQLAEEELRRVLIYEEQSQCAEFRGRLYFFRRKGD